MVVYGGIETGCRLFLEGSYGDCNELRKIGLFANSTDVGRISFEGGRTGDRQTEVDNLEADMGVLIIARLGQSIAATYKRKEYLWTATIRLPTTVVL